MSNELIEIEEKTVLDVFSNPDGLEPIIRQASNIVDDFVPDISTDKGRKEVASLAAKIARLKTRLDGLGKSLTTDWKEKAKAVDVSRKKMRDDLDALKVKAREPLTRYEQEEQARVDAHRSTIDTMIAWSEAASTDWLNSDLDLMLNKINLIDPSNMEEFGIEAMQVMKHATSVLQERIKFKKNYLAEQAELETLRKEKEALDQAAREEAMKKAAAEQAIGVERARQEKQKADEEARIRAREKNTQHVAKIRGEAKDSLMELPDGSGGFIPEELAIFIVKSICRGEIKNVSIKY